MQIQEPVQFPASNENKTQEAAENSAKKIIKRQKEPYEDVPTFLETG